MPIDKAIDSAQLDANLTAVADAIRAKGETTEQLVFPGGFVAAIAGMETGKTGATLTVTTPAEGVTVTVTKGELSYTKTTGADGTAVITGLESGTWTITISKGSQTATGTVDIDADYAAEMTFFAATINVTYPAGLVCTATDGVKTLTAPDTSGTWACVVPNAGTWAISIDGAFNETVGITQDGETQTVNKWHIYNQGDRCTSATDGWFALYSDYGTPSVSFESKRVILTAYTGTTASAAYLACNLLDSVKIGKFGVLKASFTNRTNASGSTDYAFNLKIKKTASKDENNLAYVTAASTSSGTMVLPLDGITYGCPVFGAYKVQAAITEVWFEV